MIESIEAAAFSNSSDARESPLLPTRANSDHLWRASLKSFETETRGEDIVREVGERLAGADEDAGGVGDFREKLAEVFWRGIGGGLVSDGEAERRRLPIKRIMSSPGEAAGTASRIKAIQVKM